MSFEITESFVQQYRDNVIHLAQQKGSKLSGAVRKENITGKSHYFERIGATEAVKRTSRHADTPLINTPHSRRKVSIEDYEWADLVDNQDQIRLLINPTSEYAKTSAFALGRKMDDIILEAATGTAYSGEAGGTSVTLPSANRTTEGAMVGLNLDKLITARTTLLSNDIDPDFERIHIAVHPNQIGDLLAIEKLTSADYTTVRGLTTGDPVSTGGMNGVGFMGFTWHVTTRTNFKSGSTTLRDCVVWAESGIGCAMGQDINVKISERNDKSHATQVYAQMTLGATRIEENKVHVLECYDA